MKWWYNNNCPMNNRSRDTQLMSINSRRCKYYCPIDTVRCYILPSSSWFVLNVTITYYIYLFTIMNSNCFYLQYSKLFARLKTIPRLRENITDTRRSRTQRSWYLFIQQENVGQGDPEKSTNKNLWGKALARERDQE